MTRLPRTLRMDESDTTVFDRAAAPGEWAVPGSFAFLGPEGAALVRKRRAAFAAGFLGLATFGWSTFVMVATPTPEALEEATAALARHLLTEYGAPTLAEARDVATREIAFAASLCEDHTPGTLLAVTRKFENEAVTEQFKTITPHDPDPLGHDSPFDLLALASTDATP